MSSALLLDLYPQIRLAHIGFVTASGTLFTLRAIATMTGARWSASKAARRASWLIDTGLLAAALLLLYVLQLNPFVVPWLAAKIVLLLVYIGLGTMALRRARSTSARIAWSIAALACFGMIVSIARAHDPLGFLRPWLG
ncbi:MAG: SirB2 family protein [Burkholderiaceae bacterium]|nr:SirB2 family protein [Burkholderiaceae bacterium]